MSSNRFYIDSTVFIESLDGGVVEAERLAKWFAAFRSRPFRAVTSELTLAEVMGKESTVHGWARQSRYFLDLIVLNDFVDLREVSRAVLLATGDLRRAARLHGRSIKLPDAIHVATAVDTRCQFILSSDKRLTVPAPLKRLDPHGFDLQGIEQLLDA